MRRRGGSAYAGEPLRELQGKKLRVTGHGRVRYHGVKVRGGVEEGERRCRDRSTAARRRVVDRRSWFGRCSAPPAPELHESTRGGAVEVLQELRRSVGRRQ